MNDDIQQESSMIQEPGMRHARDQRYIIELGIDIEAFGESLRWLPERQPYVYQIQLRAPVRDEQDWSMLIKASEESEPVIAFHSGRTAPEAIRTYARRLRAGKLKWREDEYPPDKFAEIAQYIEKWVEHITKTNPRLF